MIQWPWQKRANREAELAAFAHLRLDEVRRDSDLIHAHVENVHREVRLNGFLAGVLELNQGRQD